MVSQAEGLDRRRVRGRLAAVAGALVALVVPGAGQAAVTAEPASLERLVESARARHGLPGLAALVYSSDGVVDVAASGVRRQGAASPLGSGDLFHLGSLTKAVTATMLATLVAGGRLRWESRVLDLLPDLRAGAHRAYRAVTIADLVDHRAGVRAWTNGRFIPCFQGSRGSCFEGDPTEQRLSATRWLLAQRPLTKPGRYRYSNAGYVILAAIAERLTATPWETLVARRVFAPLGVEARTGWPLEHDPDQPTGHQPARGGFVPVPADAYRLPAYLAPAGDLSLTLHGYAAFARQHLRAALGKPTTILDPAALHALHPTGSEQHAHWQAGKEDGVRYLAGEGSAGTFYALSVIVPAADRGIIVITNAGGTKAQRAALAVARQALR